MGRVVAPADPSSGQPHELVLSERNLLSLATKLHTPGSACTIQIGDVPDGWMPVTVRAEPDVLHYGSPTRMGAAPGPMHPLTEVIVMVVRALLDGDRAAARHVRSML